MALAVKLNAKTCNLQMEAEAKVFWVDSDVCQEVKSLKLETELPKKPRTAVPFSQTGLVWAAPSFLSDTTPWGWNPPPPLCDFGKD